MGAFKWMVCLFVAINAASTLDPLQRLQQEMQDMKNEYFAKTEKQDRKIEEQDRKIKEQDRKIEQLEGKVRSNEGKSSIIYFAVSRLRTIQKIAHLYTIKIFI